MVLDVQLLAGNTFYVVGCKLFHHLYNKSQISHVQCIGIKILNKMVNILPNLHLGPDRGEHLALRKLAFIKRVEHN